MPRTGFASHLARGRVRRTDCQLSGGLSARLALREFSSGNLLPHDVAGGRPVGEKPSLRIEQSAFADGHLPTDMQRLSLPADDPGIGGHWSCEVNLVFERDGGKAWFERSHDGCRHTGIEQDGRITSMDEAQGIVVLCRRYRG